MAIAGACAVLAAAAGCSSMTTAEAGKASAGSSIAARSGGRPSPEGGFRPAASNAFASTYLPLPSTPTAIVNATILTAAGPQIDHGVVLMSGGRITGVGAGLAVPQGTRVIDATGKWVTPGIIDPHAHLGLFQQYVPGVGMDQANEMTDPNSAQVWAEHSIWPQDPAFSRVLAGGVTTMQILPGSGDLFGGRSVIVKNVPAVSVEAMKFPGAPQGLKMACGENPIRMYGGRKMPPETRMGEMAADRAAWQEAAKYAQAWDEYDRRVANGEHAETPLRNLKLETLAQALHGEILVNIHCYRANEMVQMLALAHEAGFHIASFHHAVEAYKIAPLLAKEHVCTAVWAQIGAAKLEMYDGIEANAAVLQRAGVCVMMHSDDPQLAEHLSREAAIAMGAGNAAGLGITPADAITWLTVNPARALGIADRTGTLESGKMADVVIWNRDPFSSYALADQVYIDGGLAYDRGDPRFQPRSDFELGQRAIEGAR